MIKGIIFDFDNTLYDYDKINKIALEYVFNTLADTFSINIDKIRSTYHKINRQVKNENNPTNKFNKILYFKKLFENLKISLNHLYTHVELYNNKFNEHFNLYPDVLDLLIFLRSKNIKIGILSNNTFTQQYLKLKNCKLIDYIDTILTSDECGEEKPSKNMFLLVQNKMGIPFEQLAYVGDSYEHDIIPSLELGMFSFFFDKEYDFKIFDKIIYFNSFVALLDFFCNYFKTINELIFLSKHFGQSVLNVQGSGGNISIKQNDIIFIKASGAILGNMSYNNGYCLANNNKCKHLLSNNVSTINDISIFGSNVPSMETYFHSFMKQYTVHLHFTLSNIYFCSNTNSTFLLDNFEYKYKIIDFYKPGIELAKELFDKYDNTCDFYFLKNHGLIITSNSRDDIVAYYEYLYIYFNKIYHNIYDKEYITFLINRIYFDNKFNVVVKHFDIPCEIVNNLKYIFPDMIVFIKNIISISNLDMLRYSFKYYDIIIYNNYVYCVAESLTKLYSLIEILESYKTILFLNNGNTQVINNTNDILEMPEEKYRALRC